jgi:hypothetical protein
MAIISGEYARYIFFDPGGKLSYETSRHLPQTDKDLFMNEFIEYFESKGIRNIKNLTAFVHDFRQEPVIFLELTESERNEMEQKLDEALAHFKD